MNKLEGQLMTKALSDIQDFLKFQEEFIGQLHFMILDIYKQTGTEIPQSVKDYKFKSRDPWNPSSL